jgi:DNA-binding SARP family transcriptional activator
MVAELAASPISDLIDIVVVGNEIELPASDRVRSVDSVDSALDMLELAHDATSDSLALVGDSDTATARRSHSAEHGWGVSLMASLEVLTVEQGQRLTSFAQGRHGVAALVVGAPLGSGSWSLTLGAKARLEPHHFELDPLPLEEAELDLVNAVLSDASAGDADVDLAGTDRIDLTEADIAVTLPRSSVSGPLEALDLAAEHPGSDTGDSDVYVLPSTSRVAAEDDFDVEIRVLGRVDIQGAETIARPRSVELAAYLALHPIGVSAARLKTAIWPESDLAQGTFNTTVYRARVGLGVDRSGQHHLPHAVNIGNCYSLGPWVTTDLARFVDLVNRSQATNDPTEEVALLRSAVDLLRGQPFEEISSGYEWAFTEGIIAEAEATIADASHRLAQLLLSDGDHAGATWAAQRGLNSVPGSEPLYRDRMEAAHLAGDPAAVDRIVEELCHYVETLDPFDDLHPETIELWRRIGRPKAAGSRPSSDFHPDR